MLDTICYGISKSKLNRRSEAATIGCAPRTGRSETAMRAVADYASTVAVPRRRRKLAPHRERTLPCAELSRVAMHEHAIGRRGVEKDAGPDPECQRSGRGLRVARRASTLGPAERMRFRMRNDRFSAGRHRSWSRRSRGRGHIDRQPHWVPDRIRIAWQSRA